MLHVLIYNHAVVKTAEWAVVHQFTYEYPGCIQIGGVVGQGALARQKLWGRAPFHAHLIAYDTQ